MNNTIENSSSRWGHGLLPVTKADWDLRRRAFLEVSAALDSRTTPEWTDELASAIVDMVRVFKGVAYQSTRDWFIMSSLCSHPSPRLAGRLAAGLSTLLKELDEDNISGINAALEHLEVSYLPQILERYLAATEPSDPTPLKEPSGWVFMLSPGDSPLTVMAGTTKGDMHEAVAAAAAANPGMTDICIVAAWRVTDTDAASAIVSSEMGYRVASSGLHSFESREDRAGAKRDLYRVLADRGIVVGNPLWEPARQKPLLEVDPYSHDISNRQFKVDVDSVFDAFRR